MQTGSDSLLTVTSHGEPDAQGYEPDGYRAETQNPQPNPAQPNPDQQHSGQMDQGPLPSAQDPWQHQSGQNLPGQQPEYPSAGAAPYQQQQPPYGPPVNAPNYPNYSAPPHQPYPQAPGGYGVPVPHQPGEQQKEKKGFGPGAVIGGIGVLVLLFAIFFALTYWIFSGRAGDASSTAGDPVEAGEDTEEQEESESEDEPEDLLEEEGFDDDLLEDFDYEELSDTDSDSLGVPTDDEGRELHWPGEQPEGSYHIEERELYPVMEEHIIEKYEFWQDHWQNGTLLEEAGLEETEENLDYAQAFMYIITDHRNALLFGSFQTSTNPGELDAIIQSRMDAVDDYEERFLNGEDLGVTVTVVQSDGEVFEYEEGEATQQENPEEFAETFEPAIGEDGTYRDSAQELAEAFGLYVTYDFESIYEGCTMHPDQDTTQVIAAYCIATPELIYVNNEFALYPDYLEDLDFIETIRHEIAHHQIGEICGAVAPSIAGDLVEGVTNSYAVLYLGADRDLLELHAPPEYLTSDETDEIAQAIAEEGRCS